MESTAGWFPRKVGGMHFTLAATSTADLVLFLIVAVAAVLWWWFQKDAAHTEIRREAARWKARVIRIEWLPCHTMNENESSYEVTLQLASGKRIKAVCRWSLHSDLVWEGTPWWAHGQPPQPTPGQPGGLSFRDTLSAHAPKPAPAPGTEPTASAPPADSLRVVADCPRCGHGLPQNARACTNCGTEVPVGLKTGTKAPQ